MLLGATQLGLKGFGDRLRNLTLDLKNVRQFSVERIRPEVAIILGFDQLNVDTNLVGRTLHASLQDVRDPELFCDCRDVVRRAFETLR